MTVRRSQTVDTGRSRRGDGEVTGMGEFDRIAGERVGGGVVGIAGGARGVFADL